VSGGAYRTRRLRADDVGAVDAHAREVGPETTLLVQPFLPEVVESGELSLLFFDGAFSHAVVKRPRTGDFRVQWSHGGTHERVRADDSLVEAARRVLAAAPAAGLYARVDGVVRDGRFLLMELEQIEPYLFLTEDPAAVDRVVDVVRRALSGDGPA
jgi:glutathione synthase/RimK-type ligase-like ATP-grasp enzyme